MTCEEVRLLIGAEPAFTGTGLEQHLHSCPACRRFREEMRALDANITRALQRPPELVRRIRTPPPAIWRQWALAASVILATLAVLLLWVLRPTDTLAREVVAHVQREPESWLEGQHVTAQDIESALSGAGVQLNITSDKVTYAQSCWFRGHWVPHLVVQTARGPATIMILRHEHVTARRAFSEAGMRGVIVPAADGSMAMLARGGGDIDDVARALQQDVRWLPGGH